MHTPAAQLVIVFNLGYQYTNLHKKNLFTCCAMYCCMFASVLAYKLVPVSFIFCSMCNFLGRKNWEIEGSDHMCVCEMYQRSNTERKQNICSNASMRTKNNKHNGHAIDKIMQHLAFAVEHRWAYYIVVLCSGLAEAWNVEVGQLCAEKIAQ